MCWRVMFGEVVSEVVGTAPPVHEELPLFDTIFDPVKTHIHGFGSSLFHGAVCDAGGTGVVCLDGSGGLWVPISQRIVRSMAASLPL